MLIVCFFGNYKRIWFLVSHENDKYKENLWLIRMLSLSPRSTAEPPTAAINSYSFLLMMSWCNRLLVSYHCSLTITTDRTWWYLNYKIVHQISKMRSNLIPNLTHLIYNKQTKERLAKEIFVVDDTTMFKKGK